MSAMPGQPGLSDAEAAAIATLVLARFNGLADVSILPEEVAAWRAAPLGHAALRDLRKSVAP
jgi:hypothetical protein